MARVPVHAPDTAPDRSRNDLTALSKRFGKTPSIFGAMAHGPALLGMFTQAEAAIAARTTLGKRTRAAIHLTVAQVNECGYCQSAYTLAATAAGFSQEEALSIRRGVLPADPGLSALLAVVREAAAHKGYVDERTWAAALEAGWTDTQLLDAFADTVRTILTNYFNHLVRTDMDLPAVPGIDEDASAA